MPPTLSPPNGDTQQTQESAASVKKQMAIQPNLPGRVVSASVRRLRLLFWRLRHRRVDWGSRCDVRTGLRLRQGPLAQITIGQRCVLDYDMTIECNGILHIGDRTIFGHHCTLASQEAVYIGDDCLIAEMVSIRDHDHCFERLDIPIREQGHTSAPVYIGRNVWLGAKVTVVSGVSIGDNAIIGANAVVTKDIPANAVAVGIPARVIRMRS